MNWLSLILVYLLVLSNHFINNVFSIVPINETNFLFEFYSSCAGDDWKWKGIGPEWNFTTSSSSSIEDINPCSTSGQYWEGIRCTSTPASCNDIEVVCHITVISLIAYDIYGQLPTSWQSLSYLTKLELSNNLITGNIPKSFPTILKSLSLSRNDLTSSLPSEIGTLTLLTSLDLSLNKITQKIPSSIGSMISLKSLDMQKNFLQSSIPSTITKLLSLQFLDLSLNDLTGKLPSLIGNLNSLVSLILFRNRFTSTLPDSISKLSSLTVLNLSFNRFRGSLPSTIGQITNLIQFQIIFNRFGGTLPPSLGNLTNLNQIRLNQNNFTGSLPPTIGMMRQLNDFSAPFNQFSSSLPSSMTQLSSLTYLDLSYNQLTGSIPYFFGSLSSLEALKISYNHLTNTLPYSISSLTSLTWFDFAENDLNGTLFDKVSTLTLLRSLILTENQLTGTIGDLSSFHYLTGLHLADNYLHGPVPLSIGSLASLKALNLENNELEGPIPSTISNLSLLTILLLAGNSLTSSLPVEIQSFQSLGYFDCSRNLLSGLLPCDSFTTMLTVTTLKLGTNYFTGSLCSQLTSLRDLSDLVMDRLYLTGTVPSSLFALTNAETFYLSDNFFSGTIPSTIGVMIKLKYFHLFSNFFSGSLPSEFGSLINLYQLLLNNNLFTGKLAIFWQPSNLTINNLDLSDNQLTGPIPANLFKIPAIETVVMTSNCFQGDLPIEICEAQEMYVFSLDGLAAADSCPFHTVISLTGVVLNNVLGGKIPQCIWSMSNLIVLSLSSNGLTGTISSIPSNSSLQYLTLSHNHLSGTLPKSLLQRRYLTLDLSFNQFIGEISDIFWDINTSTSVFPTKVNLEVNRLSGVIVKGADLTKDSNITLNMLVGNIFSCQSIPSLDEHSATYSCGSNEFDQSIILFFLTFFILSLLAFIIYFSQFSTTLPAYLTSLFSTLSSYHFFFDSNQISSYSRLISFQQFTQLKLYGFILLHLEKTIQRLCVVVLIVSLPLYILKSSDDNDNDNDNGDSYTTHTHLYRWAWTAAYVTGNVPAALLLTMCFISCLFFCFKVLQLKDVSTPSRVTRSSTSVSSPLSSFDQSSISVNNLLTYETKRRRSSHAIAVSTVYTFSRILYLLFMLLLNVAVVGIVNVLYITSTSRNLTTTVDFFIRVGVALFKLIWDGTILSRFFDSEESSSMTLIIHIINSIFLPCLVTAFTSPSCYRGLIIPPEKITSSYQYVDCAVYLVGFFQSTCIKLGLENVDVAPFTPPFSYNYICASTILSAYIPVYIYSYTFLCIFPFLSTRILLLLPSYESLPHQSLFGIPGILWPTYWNATNLSKINSVSLFPTNRRVINISKHLAVLLTFGLCCPILAFVISLSTLFSLFEWRYLLSRFVIQRTHSTSSSSSTSRSHELQDSHQSLISDPVLTHLLQPSETLISQLLSMTSLLLCTSCTFFAFVTWDIVGDDLGWEKAYWAPLTALLILFLLLGYVYWQYTRPSRNLFDETADEDGTGPGTGAGTATGAGHFDHQLSNSPPKLKVGQLTIKPTPVNTTPSRGQVTPPPPGEVTITATNPMVFDDNQIYQI